MPDRIPTPFRIPPPCHSIRAVLVECAGRRCALSSVVPDVLPGAFERRVDRARRVAENLTRHLPSRRVFRGGREDRNADCSQGHRGCRPRDRRDDHRSGAEYALESGDSRDAVGSARAAARSVSHPVHPPEGHQVDGGSGTAADRGALRGSEQRGPVRCAHQMGAGCVLTAALSRSDSLDLCRLRNVVGQFEQRLRRTHDVPVSRRHVFDRRRQHRALGRSAHGREGARDHPAHGHGTGEDRAGRREREAAAAARQRQRVSGRVDV